MNILTVMYLVRSYNKPIFYENWYKTFRENFLNEHKLTFLLVTDRPEEYQQHENVIIKKCNTPYTTEQAKQNKFKLCIDNNLDLIKQFDYIHYANCNLKCMNKVTLEELLPDNTKIAAAKHPYFTQGNFNNLYDNKYMSCVNLINENTYNMIYVQAGNILAEKNEMIKMSEFINNSLDKDLKNNIILKWHDETYFNYYLNKVKNFKDCNILEPELYNVPDKKDLKYIKDKKFIYVAKKYLM